MTDSLLHFADEAAAIVALPELRVAAVAVDEPLYVRPARWADNALPVAIVTDEAIYGPPEMGTLPTLITPRQTLPGFWLLVAGGDYPDEVAWIERETGRIVAGDETLAGARIDPAWAGGAAILFVSDVPPQAEPVPAAISDRQFAHQLAVLGAISEAEALAWAARGELPETIEGAIAALPGEQRFSARMLLASATTYERSHPLVGALADLLGYDATEIDDLWRAAAML